MGPADANSKVPGGQVAPPPQQMTATAKNPYRQDGSASGKWLLRRPASSSSRLILSFYPESCCGSEAVVLTDDVANTVPPELAARGISQEEWVQWTERFEKTVNANHVSVTCCIASFLFLVPCPCICYKLIKQQRQVEEFNEDINKQLFEPRGMFWKTQSSTIHIDNMFGENTSYTETAYWIAISLNKEDANQLKQDEHLFSGYCANHKSCICCNQFTKCCCCCGQEPQF